MNGNPWSEEVTGLISAALIANAPTCRHAESHLRAAIGDSVKRPGKLLRARLVYATTTSHGISPRIALQLATAVEYFHLSSLLLDDLPCMDDATTRRGQECVHRAHGEDTAILAALAFINRAYFLAGLAFVEQPGPVRARAHACLDGVLGTAGLVGGQARDLRFADSDGSPREISRIAMAKTGSLLRLGLALPAMLVAPNRAERRALNALCVYWGLAFQVLDDLQDVLGNDVDAGKTTGHDRALGRPNLANAIGVRAARARVARLLEQAGRRVEQLGRCRATWGYLRQIHDYFLHCAAPIVVRGQETAA